MKVLAGLFISVLVLLVLAVVLIRLPSVQNFIVGKVTGYVSSKTHTRVELKHLFIAFPKSIVIEDLFAEDLQHDTLLHVRELKVNINLLALLKNEVSISNVRLAGANANIRRSTVDSTYNFNFFIEAFSTGNKTKPVKDKEPSKWKIEVGEVELEDIRALFDDSIGGTVIKGRIGRLHLDMNSMDINNLSFKGKELNLENTDITLLQNLPGKDSPDTAIVVMPLLALNKLKLNNVAFRYERKPSGQVIDVKVGDAYGEPENIDLNAHRVLVKELRLANASTRIELMRDGQADTAQSNVDSAINHPWVVSAGKLKLENVNFNLDFTNVSAQPAGVDYNHLALSNVNIDIQDAYYSALKTTADIRNISLKEKSGFVLKQLTAQAEFDDNHASLQNLVLRTQKSTINRRLSITYPSLRSLATELGKMGVNADMPNTVVAIDDILFFAPQLKDQAVFKHNAGKKIELRAKINGKLSDIVAEELFVKIADSTVVSLNGRIRGLPDALNANYDLTINEITTTNTDLKQILDTLIPDSIQIPERLTLKGKVNGSIRDATADIALATNRGDVDVKGTFKMVSGDTAYTAVVTTRAFDIGYLLRNEKLLGPVTLNVSAEGQNFNLQNLIAKVEGEVGAVKLNGYTYHNISLNANADKETYKADVAVKDSNLVLNLKGGFSMKEKEEFVQADLNIVGANLQRLNLLEEDFRAGGKLSIDMKGDLDNMNGNASLNGVTLVRKDDIYRIDSLVVISINDNKRSSFKINSGIFMADYDGTVKISKLVASVSSHINQYFMLSAKADSVVGDTTDQNFKLLVKILPHPIISEVLLPDLNRFNGADLEANFSSTKNEMNLDVTVPVFEYKGNVMEKVSLKANSSNSAIDFALNMDNAKTGPIELSETNLTGKVANNAIDFNLHIHEDDSSSNKLIMAATLKQEKPKEYTLHIDNDKLVIADDKWSIPADNYVRFGKGFYVNNVKLSNGLQALAAQSTTESGDAMDVSFDKFQLATLSKIVERDTAWLRGTLDGTINLKNLSTSMAFVSDLSIKNIEYLLHPVGDVTLKADNLTSGRYSAELKLTGAGNDVSVNGYYSGLTESGMNFKADINRLNLQTVEPFTFGQIRNSSGYITGSVTATGKVTAPKFNGDVSFKEAAMNVAYINNYLTLKDERLSVDPQGIYFKSFQILDSMGQKAVINGSVYTTNFKNMKFDVTVNTNRFTVLNTTIKDNPLYFGRVILSSNIRVKGTEQLPIVRADLRLVQGSNIAVVIPSSKVSVDRGEGVVVLTDTAAAYSILQQLDTVQIAPAFKGVDVTANIDIDKQTSFKLIVDKISGDSLVVKGEGRLSFAMDEGGNQNLTGTYIVNDGGYRATFQKIVKRELKIQPGGSIVWNGNPLDANVDITAIYAVRTSPADLLAADLSGTTTEEMNAYQKLIDFQVLMSMQGKLLKPEISFKLDMPEQDKNAYGGVVYSKVNSLNNDPSELNKQVFALIVMNRFIPAGVGNGNGVEGAATNFARNSVSQILTDQLNRLSGQFVKGFDLNVGIRSNDDYTATGVQQNTELSVGVKKSFFKDRLSVQVGTSVNVNNQTGSVSGTDAENLTGDIVIEYKINKDGTMRFKAFRENQYEGIIDGSLYKTGVGFVINKDYDTPVELFKGKKKAREIMEKKKQQELEARKKKEEEEARKKKEQQEQQQNLPGTD